MVFTWLKDYYLKLRYGFNKRPARLKLRGLVTVVSAKFKHEEDKYARAALIDISRSGIAIESFSEFREGEEVMLQFTLPSRHINIAGFIVRCHHQPSTFVYGIKFHREPRNMQLAKQIVAFAKLELKKMTTRGRTNKYNQTLSASL